MTKARVNADNASADIQGVTAGTGLTGGGTSGTVTLTNDMATAIAAKGDLVAGTANDTYAALTVGANGTVLTADSVETTGLKWATPTTNKSYTLLNAGGTALTGAGTITVSGISDKDNLLVIVDGCSSASGGSTFRIRFNADSGSNYQFAQGQKTSQSAYGVNIFETNASAATTSITIGKLSADAGGVVTGGFSVYGAASTGYKAVQFNTGAYTPSGSQGGQGVDGVGMYFATAAITSVSIISGTGNFDAGTIYVYGA
jgi:hypothetical protein